ncbi:MAG: TraE family protein, partial [Oscillospiraceae bacterium]|nr:TraE family protein [Oscillospiraceae bacterium]
MRNIREAKEYFKRTFTLLNEYLSQLGSKCYELNAMERLKILHNFYRPDEENDFHFDYEDMRIKGHSFKDYISPDSFEKHSDYVVMGDKYVRVMYLKDYSTELKDKLIQDLLGVNKNTMLSVDIIAIPTDEAVRYVQQKSLGVETEITNWQRRQNNNNNFSAEPPQQYVNERFNARDIIDYLTLGDQRMMQAVLTIMIAADSKEQLDSDTKAIQRKALGHSAQVAILRYQQMDGINTVLPVGARKINTFRTMLT